MGELACWRWRAGVREELSSGAAAEPHALSIVGEWVRATQLWREIGGPYQAALALADADDEEPLPQAPTGGKRWALAQLLRSSPVGCAREVCREGHAHGRERTRPV